MIDRIMSDNNQYIGGDEKIAQIDPNSEEFQELQFHFNTIFNDMSRSSSSEQKTFGIERAFSLKNKYIALNFDKRAMNEITSYGWYISETNDEKKFEELIYRLKLKGQDKVGFDINVCPPPPGPNDDIHDIFICKFIVGDCYILFQGDELEKSKEELAENYDTIVKISDNDTKKYEALKPENIELLYLVKIKNSDFEPKTVQCTATNCKLNEAGAEMIQPQDKKICYCLLSDSYLCKNCHIEFHQGQIFLGDFGPENCEQKPFINNYQGECENPAVHPKKETIEFFCKGCNKGICSFCRFNSNEKHKDLHLITNLFYSCSLDKNPSFKEIKDEFIPRTRELSLKVSDIQRSNKNAANKLRELIVLGFKKMFNESNDAFTHEGELLLGMCYQLNYLKDCILNFHKLYDEREALLRGTKLKQELYWTKRMHYDNLLYLINVKEMIKTGYKVDHKNFDKIINKYKKRFQYPISVFEMMDDFGYKEIGQSKQNMNITYKILVDEAGINNQKLLKKNQK
jgi:hypothetical protein